MNLAIALCPIYDAHKKNAHSLAAKAWAVKIIGLLSGRQNLKLTAFFTGQMLEALKNEKKEVKLLKKFIANKQLEFLGGAYNEAMLPLFPKTLQKLCLQKHREILSHFMEPSGHFCPSHAWEIAIAERLEKMGFSYTLMPDVSIQDALGRKSAVSGWFAAEYGASFVRILTYSQHLSSIAQTAKRAEIINACRSNLSPTGINTILLTVDLDNLTTQNEWLQAIDTAAAEGLDIKYNLLCDAVEKQKAAGKVNLISYSSFAPSSRDILLRMPEINLLHKRILNVYFKALATGDLKIRNSVFEALLNAMHQSYFKNTADGMKRDALRFYANREVMKARKILRDHDSEEGIRFSMSGFLLDGNQQLALSNQKLECLIESALGGYIRSLSYKPSFSELACSMRDDGEVSPICLDHICPVQFENLDQRNEWINDRLGAMLGPYESNFKKQDDKVQVIMQSEQDISCSGKDYFFKTEKVFTLKDDDADLTVSVSITNASFNAFNGEIATELCLGFRNDARGQRLKIGSKRIKLSHGGGFYADVRDIDFKDRFLKIGANLNMNKSSDILCIPILGVGTGAAPDTVQGLRLVAFRKANLKGQETETFHLRIRLNSGGYLL